MLKHNSAITRWLIYSFTHLFFLLHGNSVQAQNHPIQDILALLERGQFASASHLLQANLQMNPSDSESRILLGSIMEHSGMRMEAIRLWQQGLQNNASDYPLLMSIGESYLHEAELRMQEGSASNSLLPANGMPWECMMLLDSAIASFQQATLYYPHEAEPLYQLANAYQLKSDYQQALYYAELLARIYPTDEKNHTLMGLLLIQLEDYERAYTTLQQAISLNPTYTPALKAMAELMIAQDCTEEAGQLMQKAAFHDFVPSFIHLPFHEKNYRLYSQLIAANSNENEEELRNLLMPFLEDKSNETTQWIALMFWHQAVPADLDEIAWDEFTTRGMEAQRLMMEMAQRTDNWILLGRLCRKMVQLQTPGIFELLTELLPKDKVIDSPLRIAYCMASLGNELSIPYLIRELQDVYSKEEQEEWTYHFSHEGHQAARQRAALALAYFDSPIVIAALQKQLSSDELKPYCAAALYKLTLEERYLDIVRQSVASGLLKDAEIAQFLRLVGSKEAERIADMMME
ncbi:MAG: hypothetical protein RMJ87_01740 [Cytophagales bacterium]|nr:hypothetical protein [Bernardetiaceae bacterium]MDW8203724.1 hypothetical protein [Cytophagales bacterium]